MLLYLTMMVRPVLPIVIDWYQHEFNEIEHLACVHAQYGSQHLQREVAESAAENGQPKKVSCTAFEDPIPFHIPITEAPYAVLANLNRLEFFHNIAGKLPQTYILCDGPPPRNI